MSLKLNEMRSVNESLSKRLAIQYPFSIYDLKAFIIKCNNLDEKEIEKLVECALLYSLDLNLISEIYYCK